MVNKLIKLIKNCWLRYSEREHIQKVKYSIRLLESIIETQTPISPIHGVCVNVELSDKMLRQFSLDWEQHSGVLWYAVGGREDYHFHFRQGSLWQEYQLELRLSFCKHLYNSMTNWLKEIGEE